MCTVTSAASAPATGRVGTAVAFTGSATDPNCTGTIAYSWNFGDGSALSSSQSPSHTYAAAGTFQWTMTASVAGVVSTKTGSIVIAASTRTPPPSVSGVRALSNPFRLQINGAGFQQGVRVYIGSRSTAWSSVQRVSSSQLVLSGDGLSSLFPRGTAVRIRIVNRDGQSATTSYTRPSSRD